MPRHRTCVKVHPPAEEIPWGAFHDCTSLEVVVIPPIRQSDRAFENCSRLRNLEVYEGLEMIE
jgi:hypothetical protein